MFWSLNLVHVLVDINYFEDSTWIMLGAGCL